MKLTRTGPVIAALIVGALATGAMGRALLPPPGPVPINLADPVVTPDLTAGPTPEDFAAAWPAAAKAAGLAGRAHVECRIASDRLADCRLFSEFPGGQGFGAAALSLTERYRVAPQLAIGLTGRPDFGRDNPLRYGEASNGHRVRLLLEFGRAKPDSTPTPAALTADESVVDVAWDTAPGVDQAQALFPQRAQRNGQSGRATLSCRFSKKGYLTDCSVAESVFEYGFGLAGLQMARYFRAKPLSKSGRPVAGRTVHVPIYFAAPP